MSTSQQERFGNDSFKLPETDSGTDSDSDSKPYSYIILCKTWSHCSDSEPYSLSLLGTGIRVPVSTRVVSGNVNEPLEQKRNLYLI